MEMGGFLTYQINIFRKSLTLTDTMKLDSMNWKNPEKVRLLSTTTVVIRVRLYCQADALTEAAQGCVCSLLCPSPVAFLLRVQWGGQRCWDLPGLVRHAEPWVPSRPTL